MFANTKPVASLATCPEVKYVRVAKTGKRSLPDMV